MKEIIATGEHRGYVWSGGGYEYAKAFVAKYGIDAIPLPKPDIYVDDNPEIRPKKRMIHVSPQDFLNKELPQRN